MVTQGELAAAVQRANTAATVEILAKCSGDMAVHGRAIAERKAAEKAVQRLENLMAEEQRESARPLDTTETPRAERLWKVTR